MRRVGMVLVCEDREHESFARRFLVGMGWEFRQFRVEKAPKGLVSAESWVRAKFPDELAEYRRQRARAATALLTMIDADTNDVQDRIRGLEEACRSRGVPFRTSEDSVAIAVPKRAIEIWIHHLTGHEVNEQEDYKKFVREADCRRAVDNLVSQCRSTGLSAGAPTSLAAACSEYQDRVQPVRRP